MIAETTEAQTEVAPLTPHNQGINAGDFDDASFIPIGNGIPIKNPSGNRIAPATRIRIGVVALEKCTSAYGVSGPKRDRTTSRGMSRVTAVSLLASLRVRRSATKLPRPLEIRRTKRTTESA